ncbi:glycosyl hydrolase family 61-domain-containing protein [Xylariaceae sp. FL0016]|nr:glycosyl hydrolase family 61-domain-containing protein [Xylariaceae sp. FL0016]
MKSFSTLISLATLATAHYTFDQLVVNDELVGSANTYIREHTRSYQPTKGDQILENDFRCNQAAVAAPEVMSVVAGDRVALKQAYGGTGMIHPGPTQVYMSLASSGDVTTYEGDGDWFKVHQSLLCTAGDAASLREGAWCMYGEDRIEFEIPSTIPDGQYLVRAEHIALHGAHDGQAEFYYACAQVSVSGNSATAVPTPTTLIPVLYNVEDPEINFSLWGSSTSYDFIPGIEVASGGTIRGSADGSSGDVTETVAGSGSGSSSSGTASSGSASPVASTPSYTSAVAEAATSAAVSSGSSGATAALYQQCGGMSYSGPTTCASGTCTQYSEYYSQCV